STYDQLLKKYPRYHQIDLVIFNYAFAHQSLGQGEQAEKLYWTLISKHPSSQLVPDAHLAIGEIAFEKGKFKHALNHFLAIEKYPSSRVYPYGLYKAAWTYYNLRDAKSGLAKLEEVVRFGEYVSKNQIESRLDLRKEALMDMTLFFTEVYSAKDAYAYFTKQSGEIDVAPILMKVATLYERYSRYNDVNVVLNRFIEELPLNELVPEAHEKLISSYENVKNRPQVIAQMEDFYGVCQPQSKWSKAHAPVQSENSKKVPEIMQKASCDERLYGTALELAQKWLRIYNKNSFESSYADFSEKAFEIYLRSNTKTKAFSEARFLYAELLFKRKKFRKASEEYAAVGSAAGSKISHDASYAALLSLEKAVGDKWSDEDEKSFHTLAQEYVKSHPKGAYRVDIEFKMGLLAYEKGRYDEAAPIFLTLGERYPKSEKGQKAQDLYLDILNIKKDYAGIKNYSAKLIKLGGKADRIGKLKSLFEESYFMQVQLLEDKKEFKKALAGYTSFVRENPSSKLAQQAIWNISQLHYNLGDEWEGAQASFEFAQKFPKAKESQSALIRAAQSFEKLAQLPEAAQVLSVLAQRDAKESDKWKELSADFYAMSGKPDRARELYQDVAKRKSKKEYGEFLLKQEDFEKNYGSPGQLAVIRRQIVSHGVQPAAHNARVTEIEELYERKKSSDAFHEALRALALSGWDSSQKARLRFVQAQVLVDEFLSQSVKARADRIAMVLAIKTEKLEKAQQALQAAMKYGDSKVAVGASQKLYECYSHYVDALKTMPTPQGLSGEDAQVFRNEVQNLIIPLEEKSVDTLAQALRFARKNQMLDGSIQNLERELASVNQRADQASTLEFIKPQIVIPHWKGAKL
ncbi:MAG TPA: hypothetical protein DCL41_05130, partial [Bdellovibrionales bacterium]|nr:hypothetical protein [Bdellovibrionales bacterium]